MATGIKFTGNIGYKGTKPLDDRQQFATVSEMKSFAELGLNDRAYAFVEETKKLYRFHKENEVDATLGKWQVIEDFTPELKEQLTALQTASGNYATTENVSTAKQEAITAANEAAEAAYIKKTDAPLAITEAGGKYVFKFNEQTIKEINIVKDTVLKSASIRETGGVKELVLVVSTEDEGTKELKVDVSELVDTYTAGTGLTLQGNEFSLEATYTALPNKVTTLEGNPMLGYSLGFTQESDKFPVKEQDGKLYVEIQFPVYEFPDVATASTPGLMSANDKTKLDSLSQMFFIVNPAEFEEKEAAGKTIENRIYFLDEKVKGGSTPEAYKA